MRSSPSALLCIKHFEGFRAKAYLCPSNVPTIGYGHTGRDVRLGMKWTEERANQVLLGDIVAFERDVNYLVGSPFGPYLNSHTTQGQFDALVSFAFNCGSDIDKDTKAEGLGDSSLLRKHLACDFAGAAQAFNSWIYGGGRKLPGLVVRRRAEKALYEGKGLQL